MRKALVLAAALFTAGCIAPITPMERLQQSANEVAAALRFNRTDLVAEYCAPKAREAFLSRHAVWSDKTRVVDLELTGIYLRSSDEAEALIEVAWLREDGTTLHTTGIAQKWRHVGGSYKIVDEVWRSGDKLLFDMLPKVDPKADPKKDESTQPASDLPPARAMMDSTLN